MSASTATTRLLCEQIEALKPNRIVISPGPCTPNEAGVSVETIRHFAGRLPLLGVCLGHQSLAVAFGGEVVRAERLDARQDVDDPARRTDDFPAPAESLRRDSLSFADCQASKPPVLFRGIRRNSRRRNHGHAPYRPSASKACSFIRNRS